MRPVQHAYEHSKAPLHWWIYDYGEGDDAIWSIFRAAIATKATAVHFRMADGSRVIVRPKTKP